MKEERNIYELIDAYLDGTLPNDHEFIHRLAHDVSLAGEVELQKIIRQSVIDHRLSKIGQHIKALQPQRQFLFRSWYGLLLAFVMAGLFVGSLFRFYNQSHKSNADLSTVSTGTPKAPFIKKEHVTENEQEIEVFKPEIFSDKQYEKPGIAPHAPALKSSIPYKIEEHLANVIDNVPAIETTVAATTTQVPFIKPQPSIVKAIDACDTVEIRFDFKITPSCSLESNGMLRFINFSGGHLPYSTKIHGRGDVYELQNEYTGLAAGVYPVIIKDGNGCKSSLITVEVPNKECLKPLSEIFNPYIEDWRLPLETPKSGLFTIIDNNGRQVYSQNFENLTELAWNGKTNNNVQLLPGFYIYTVEVSKEVIKDGTITIAY